MKKEAADAASSKLEDTTHEMKEVQSELSEKVEKFQVAQDQLASLKNQYSQLQQCDFVIAISFFDNLENLSGNVVNWMNLWQ